MSSLKEFTMLKISPITLIVLGLGALTSIQAETSPLSSLGEGYGLEVSSYTARERAMGEAGMASVNKSGPSLSNPSRTAWNEKTSFSATFESDVDYLQDNSTSNRTSTFLLPEIAMNFQTRIPLNIGVFYRQRFHRNFSYTPLESLSPVSDEGLNVEGGLYEVGTTIAYAPIPILSLALGYNYMLGRERNIKTIEFTENAGNVDLFNGKNLTGDTISIRGNGGYPSASMTFRQKNYSFAASASMAATLERTLSRAITGMGSDQNSKDERDIPWSFMVGGAYKMRPNQTLVADFSWQSWEESQAHQLNPAYHLGAGYEYQGAAGPYERYYRKVAYRGGAGYDRVYLDKADLFYVTAGAGLPLGKRGNLLDFAMKYGHRESLENSLWSEDFVKLSVTLTGVGVWGQPVRKRR
jgi:hypothetical protein